MKLIDLLVKIANRDEDLPKEIEILGNNYILRHSTHMPNYFRKDKIGISISEDLALIKCLTDEVEIIEDKPKKMIIPLTYEEYCEELNLKEDFNNPMINFLNCTSKTLNELAKKLNYLLEKSDKDE